MARQTIQTIPSLSYLSKWGINSHRGKAERKQLIKHRQLEMQTSCCVWNNISMCTLNMCQRQIIHTGLRLERKLPSLVTLAVLGLIIKSETMNY